MRLLKHESQYWPLALTLVSGEATLEEHLESLDAWNQWFSKAQPFHVIRVYLDDGSLRHPDGAAQATQRWMSEGAAEHMRKLVQSMLIVVPPDQYERMQKMSVRKAFGIPGGLFPSLDEAYAWLANPPEEVEGLPVAASLLEHVRHYVKGMAEVYQTDAVADKRELPSAY
jgi:hypothetical protein